MPVATNETVAGVEMRYTAAGSKVENTLWFHKTSGMAVVSSDLEDLTETLHTWYLGSLKAIQGAGCVLREIYARGALPDPAPVWTRAAAPTDFGSALGQLLPNNATFTIAFKTGFSGRSYAGRNYAVGMTEDQSANSIAAPAYIELLQDAYNGLASSLVSAGGHFIHVVYSQVSGGVPRVEGVWTPINTYIIVDDTMDSQRRRLPGRGT